MVMEIIDIHLHVGQLFEWSPEAVRLWMDSGPYRPLIYDDHGRLGLSQGALENICHRNACRLLGR